MDKQNRTRRRQPFHHPLLAALLWILLSTVAPGPAPFAATGPAEGSLRDMALRHVQDNLKTLGLTRADLEGMVLKDEYKTRHNGVTHLYFQQQLDGLEIVNALLGVHVGPQGRVVGLHSRFVPDLERAVKARKAAIDAGEALERAISHLDLPAPSGEAPRKLRSGAAASKEVVFSGSAVSQDEIPVKLCYVVVDKGDVRLAWSSVVRLHNNRHWYNVFIDADTGDLLAAHDWVGRFAPADDGAGYRVFPMPLMNPDEGQRSLVKSPADPTASPYGWHDTDGAPGPEYTDTQGNNVRASSGSGVRPSARESLQFDFPLDLGKVPASSSEASVANLFYWVNTLHDLHYRYGFDEAAGNFQLNNYGKGGLAGDPVDATALVGEMVTFATPPDGISPKMRLFIATPITAVIPMKHFIALRSGSGPAREIPATGAVFGSILKADGVTGRVVQAKNRGLDNAAHPGGPPALSGQGAGERSDACTALTNARLVRGKIALVNDGNCSVIVKARHAQKAGATGMILIGEDDKPMKPLGGWHGAGDDIHLPVVGVIAKYGPEIRKRSGQSSEVKLYSDNRRLERDSSLDAGVLIHEYGHGVVSRLTGGPSSAGCVQGAQSMGMVEGTGDFWALAFTAKRADLPAKPRAISTYVFFQPLDGRGVRGVSYTTDAKLNSHTSEDLAGLSGPMVPHGAGTIWATTLWEVYWKLVEAHGFDPDLYQGRGGNNLMLQLVMDGLKLQPCNPTLIEARDAILLADQIKSGGKNQCLLWQGFARRGFGVDAVDTTDPDNLKITAGYKVPAQCGPAPEPARIPGHKNDHLHNFG